MSMRVTHLQLPAPQCRRHHPPLARTLARPHRRAPPQRQRHPRRPLGALAARPHPGRAELLHRHRHHAGLRRAGGTQAHRHLRTFLARAKLDPAPFEQAGVQLLYLEDLRKRITPWAKLTATLRTFFPAQLPTLNSQPSDTAVILFTSGSEGVPKGVELSHRNILANIRQMLAVTDLTDQDRLFNCLPLFHSFGLTVGLLVPLVRGMFCFIYPSPLHYRVIPSVLYDRDCTVLLSTNTFLNGYGRKAHAYDFRSMRYLFAAAEKLQAATAQTWSHRFGVRVLEGMAPPNVPRASA